jgi:hypothetical protein
MDQNRENIGGGFPPIFECNFDKNITEQASKNLNKVREFAEVKKAISIKDIMSQKKKEVTVDISS